MKKLGFILVLFNVISIFVGQVSSLVAPSNPSAQWQSLFSKLFSQGDAMTQSRSNLKQQLRQKCRDNFGKNDANIRGEIESVIDDLVKLNPTEITAASPLLMKEWELEWTTEKEINFFLQYGISKRISQTLDNGVLTNYIPFVKGGGFGVTGEICIDDAMPCRTNFKFKNAELDLGKWGVYNFPPVGEGWFDTIYLDDELRIDSNSRNDILICSSHE